MSMTLVSPFLAARLWLLWLQDGATDALRQRAHALACFRWTTIVSLLQLDVCGPSSYPSPSSLPSKHARNTRTSDMPPKKKPKHDPNQTTLNLAGGALGVRRDVVAGEPQQRRITGFVPRNPPPPPPPVAAPAPVAPPAPAPVAAPAPAPPVAAPAPARPINSDTDDDEFAGPPCCVCLRARRDHAFLPCGHRCVCGPCGRMVSRREGPRCPMCRARIQSVQQIYT